MSTTITETTKTLKIKVKKILVTDLCEELFIPYLKCKQATMKDKKGNTKKYFPKGCIPEKFADWDLAKCEEWNNNIKFQPTHINVLLNKAEGIDKLCVIDFDSKEDIDPYIHLFGNDWISKSSQRKLPHLWRMRKENDFSKCTTKIPIDGNATSIDIKYYNIIERIDSKIEYTGNDTPPEFDFEKFHPKPITEKQQAKLPKEPSSQYTVFMNNYTGRRFINHLQNINHTEYTNNYSDWLKIGFAIKHIFYNELEPTLWFEILIAYSRLSSDHQDEDIDDWEKMFQAESKCGIPTILHYSKISNEKRFIEIDNEYYKAKRDDKNDEQSALLNAGYASLMEALKKNDEKQELDLKSMNCYINDDYQACESVKRMYGNNIVKGIDTWYVQMPNTTHWEKGEEFIKQLIMISKIVKGNGNNTMPYGSNTTGCNNIFKAICSSPLLFPLNEDFINNINMKTKGKLFFNDKYWDFSIKKWFSITDVIPLVFIKRNAPIFNFTEDEITEFKNKVLNMFSNDTDRNLYLQALSRGLAGYTEDKKFYVMKGLRNSGKGVLQEMCIASCGEYVCVYDAPMSKTNNNQDASDRRWVLTTNAHIKRIGFTNEIKDVAGKNELTLDGNEMKKVICSGGDAFTARGHYKDEVTIKNNITTFMSLNNIPTAKPADALENMILFDMPYKFVDKNSVAEDVMYREADPTIKEKIKTNSRWADIFLYLIFEAFKSTPVQFSDMSEVNQAETMCVLKEANSNNPIKLFNDAFIRDESGWVSTEDIKKALIRAKLNDVKLSQFLKDRGFVQKRGSLISKKDENGNDMKDENGAVKKYTPYGYAGLSIKELAED